MTGHKKLLSLLACIFSLLMGYGQVPKYYFEKGVESVKYVTVNLCINNQARIDKVELISEKTTYENIIRIEELKNYLLTIQYHQDSQLRNNCYESYFIFLNPKYRDSKVIDEPCTNTSMFKKGRFKYGNPNYSSVDIIRGDSIQKELGGNMGNQIYKIDWTSDCSYNLIPKKMSDERLKEKVGSVLHVQIIDILSSRSYVYRSTADFKKWATYGIITLVDQ